MGIDLNFSCFKMRQNSDFRNTEQKQRLQNTTCCGSSSGTVSLSIFLDQVNCSSNDTCTCVQVLFFLYCLLNYENLPVLHCFTPNIKWTGTRIFLQQISLEIFSHHLVLSYFIHSDVLKYRLVEMVHQRWFIYCKLHILRSVGGLFIANSILGWLMVNVNLLADWL